jgi:DNA-binding NarL/FixJ family response regulator
MCKHKVQPDSVGPLTRREREVVALIGKGLTNRQIAQKLVIEECTVENHVHRIMRKLGFTTRVQIARYAWEHGIEPEIS